MESEGFIGLWENERHKKSVKYRGERLSGICVLDKNLKWKDLSFSLSLSVILIKIEANK